MLRLHVINKEDSHEDHSPNYLRTPRSSQENKEASQNKNVKLTIQSSKYKDNDIKELHGF